MSTSYLPGKQKEKILIEIDNRDILNRAMELLVWNTTLSTRDYIDDFSGSIMRNNLLTNKPEIVIVTPNDTDYNLMLALQIIKDKIKSCQS